jgi:hypothetical protein
MHYLTTTMNNSPSTNTLGILAIAVATIAAGLYLYSRVDDLDTTDPVVVETESVELCYYSELETERGLKDVSALQIITKGIDVVGGRLDSIPAEKDSKRGEISGVIRGSDDSSLRIADVWWDSAAEGMSVREQLMIQVLPDSARVGFGEMSDRGDGVYVYADPASITYGAPITEASCVDVMDRVLVEEYIRANIQTLVLEKPTLGGFWYVVGLSIEPGTRTGVVTYEDGHIQGQSSFIYTRIGNKVTVQLQSVQQ